MSSRQIPAEFGGFVGEGKRYTKLDFLGEGSEASVFSLRDSQKNRDVAGKFVKANNWRKGIDEFEVMRKCGGHPNIVRCYEAHQVANGDVLCVSELGLADYRKTLNDRFIAKRKPVEEQDLLCTAVQLCLALRHLHRERVIHRDLKAENILIMPNGLVKLTDFGFSREYDCSVSNLVGETFLGTKNYIAPELWRGNYSKKIDVWALGVFLHELMTLTFPWDIAQMRDVSTIVDILEQRPPTRLRESSYSDDVKEFVEAMLKPQDQERPNMEQLLESMAMRRAAVLMLDRIFRSSGAPPSQDIKDLALELAGVATRLLVPDFQVYPTLVVQHQINLLQYSEIAMRSESDQRPAEQLQQSRQLLHQHQREMVLLLQHLQQRPVAEHRLLLPQVNDRVRKQQQEQTQLEESFRATTRSGEPPAVPVTPEQQLMMHAQQFAQKYSVQQLQQILQQQESGFEEQLASARERSDAASIVVQLQAKFEQERNVVRTALSIAVQQQQQS